MGIHASLARLPASGAYVADAPAPQRTLRAAIGCTGHGLHSGHTATMRLLPAPAGHGIVFRRTDLGIDIPARFDRVADTRLCTVLADDADPSVRVGTVEHLMAALAACGVGNLVVEIDGPELPILDGSAEPFVFLIDCAGIAELDEPAPVLEVLRTVRVEDGAAFAELRPDPRPGFQLSIGIDFDAGAIGRQALSLRLDEAGFRRDLATARTFAMRADIAALQAAGLARGGSLDNAVVVDGAAVLNPGGLHQPDEFVRHKMLDAVGDLALGALPGGTTLRARLSAHRPGHGLNNRLLRALFADPAAWRIAGAEWAPMSVAA